MMKKLLVCTFSLLCLCAMPTDTLACACCVDPGYYSISTQRPDSYLLNVLDEIKFAAPADIYMTEAGWDGIKGLNDLDMDEDGGKKIDLSRSRSGPPRAAKVNSRSQCHALCSSLV